MKKLYYFFSFFLVVAASSSMLTAPVAGAADDKLPSQTDVSLRKELDVAVEKAVSFLFSKQNENGSWYDNPAITGLAMTALLRSPKGLTDEQRKKLELAARFIVKFVKPDGSIHDGRYANYSTSICGMALLATGKQEYLDVVKRARDYTLKSQISEAHGFTRDYAGYGGIGYGDRDEQKNRPDLSNTGFAIEFLALTEDLDPRATDAHVKPEVKKLHFRRALTFLQRCQHLEVEGETGNDKGEWRSNDPDHRGGAVYSTVETRGRIEKVRNEKGEEIEIFIPYGSMTYTLLKSYIFCELDKNDRRVKAAMDWLARNFTVEENPGLGAQGLYYYYMSMAKALSAAQVDWITLPDGKKVDWRYELMKKLVNLQKGDGSWVNDKGRWQENDPVLVTSYALLVLDITMARRYP
jgi:squalene-hopene/tetraprenyl-beta-curcumene cyclase